jgi:hypothetical protein
MFRYLLVDHAVPAMCRSLAAARLSARREALKGLDATTTVDVGHVDRYASSAAGPAFAAKHRATAWWSSPASRRDGILMLSGMTRIRRQKVVGAGIKPLVKEGFRFVDLATKGGTARVTATAPRTAQIITPLGPVSSTAKGRLHALSQQRTFSAPLTNSANFFRA